MRVELDKCDRCGGDVLRYEAPGLAPEVDILCESCATKAVMPASIPEGWTDFVLRTHAPCSAFGPKIGGYR